MPQVDIKDTEPVLTELIETTVDRYDPGRGSFYSDERLHPWKYSLRELVKLLNGLIRPPHQTNIYSWNCDTCDEARQLIAEANTEKRIAKARFERLNGIR